MVRLLYRTYARSAFVLFVAFSLYSATAAAVEKLDIKPDETCNYYGKLVVPTELYGFESDAEAAQMVRKILHYSGLEPNFNIQAANVPNAAAVLRANRSDGIDRLILYSQDFMERVKNRTRTDWSAISILAHEIGHHL